MDKPIIHRRFFYGQQSLRKVKIKMARVRITQCSKACKAIFENGVLRPLTNLLLNEGEAVELIIESHSNTQIKCFPETGLIAQLTANPIVIKDFQPLTREENNERW